MKKLYRIHLSKRLVHILKRMHEEELDLVCSKGVAYVGEEGTSKKTILKLLKLCLISCDDYSNFDKMERYVINEDGVKAYQNGFIDRPI